MQPDHGESNGSPSSRWWEGYLVRYLIGTFVGCVAVSILAWKIHGGEYQRYIADYIFNKEYFPQAWLALIGIGFAYCYLASTPITVIHVSRSLGRVFPNNFARYVWFLSGLASFFAVLFNAKAELVLWVAAFPALWMAFSQWACIVRLMDFCGKCSMSSDFVNFYKKLSVSRGADGAKFQLRESYTHLREHANAVFIVVIELSLLSLMMIMIDLFKEEFYRFSLMFSFIWLVPNILLWGRANKLEELLFDESNFNK